jgi:hypothetical protein
MSKTVTISQEKLQKLVTKFYDICNICEELDVYEHKGLDKSLQKKESWVDKHFGREIDKDNYE